MLAIIFFGCCCCGFLLYKAARVWFTYRTEKAKDKEQFNKMQMQVNAMEFGHQKHRSKSTNFSKNTHTTTTNISDNTPTMEDNVASMSYDGDDELNINPFAHQASQQNDSNNTNRNHYHESNQDSTDFLQPQKKHRKQVKTTSASAIRNGRAIYLSNSASDKPYVVSNSKQNDLDMNLNLTMNSSTSLSDQQPNINEMKNRNRAHAHKNKRHRHKCRQSKPSSSKKSSNRDLDTPDHDFSGIAAYGSSDHENDQDRECNAHRNRKQSRHSDSNDDIFNDSNDGEYDDDSESESDTTPSESTDNGTCIERSRPEKKFEHLRIPSLFTTLKQDDSMRAEAGSKEPSQHDVIEVIAPIRHQPQLQPHHHRHKTSLQTVIIHDIGNPSNRKLKIRTEPRPTHSRDMQSLDDFMENSKSAASREDIMDSLNVNPSMSSPSYAIQVTQEYFDEHQIIPIVSKDNFDKSMRKFATATTVAVAKNPTAEIKIDPIPETIEFAATPQYTNTNTEIDDPSTPLSQNTVQSMNTYTLLFGPSRRNSSDNGNQKIMLYGDVDAQTQATGTVTGSNANDEEDKLSLGATATPTAQRAYLHYL